MLGNPKVKLFSSMSKKSAVRRHMAGVWPSASSANSLVTQAHRLSPPGPQSSGHSQRLADICGQMGPCVVSIYAPKGTTAYPAAGSVTWEAAWDSGPLDEHVAPAAPRIPKAHQLRGCLWPEDEWTVGLWGVSPRCGRKVRRGVTHLPHGP